MQSTYVTLNFLAGTLNKQNKHVQINFNNILFSNILCDIFQITMSTHN